MSVGRSTKPGAKKSWPDHRDDSADDDDYANDDDNDDEDDDDDDDDEDDDNDDDGKEDDVTGIRCKTEPVQECEQRLVQQCNIEEEEDCREGNLKIQKNMKNSKT